MIQKIKLYGISMGAAAVILLSGAWKNLPEKEPEATEAIVLQDEVTQENQSAVKETQAREEAVKCWCDTQVRRYSEQEASYAAEEKQFEEKQREREEKERRRRERKRREEKRRQEAADLGTDCRSRGRRSGSGRPDSGGKCNFEPRPFQTFSRYHKRSGVCQPCR